MEMSLNGKVKGDLSLLERINLSVGTIVSLCVIISSVWYAAIAVNNLTHAVHDTNKEMSRIHKILEKNEEDFTGMRSVNLALAKNQEYILRSAPRLVHVDSRFAVMESPAGDQFRLTVYREELDEFE